MLTRLTRRHNHHQCHLATIGYTTTTRSLVPHGNNDNTDNNGDVDLMAVPLTGALVYSQRDGDLENKNEDERVIDDELAELKATLTIEFEAERVAVAGSKDEAALLDKFELLCRPKCVIRSQ